MNKKQLVVIWVMGVLICLLCIFPPVSGIAGSRRAFIFAKYGRVKLENLFTEMIPVFIIGSLLIYTLRDKKK